jgi:phosphatidylethanolamine-binding protein (PEBP) family uncharacterized protein
VTQRGALPESRRSRQPGLAWDSPNLAGEQTLALSSPDFGSEGTIPAVHAATRAGGANLSPALTWSTAPPDTAQLLLVIEDPDAPTPMPFIHCLALLDTSVTGLARGALDARDPSGGVPRPDRHARRRCARSRPPRSSWPAIRIMAMPPLRRSRRATQRALHPCARRPLDRAHRTGTASRMTAATAVSAFPPVPLGGCLHFLNECS